MKRLFTAAAIIIIMNTGLFASYSEALDYYQSGKYKESLKIIAGELKTENDLDPKSENYKLRFLAAHNHWKLGNMEAAIIHFKRCIDIKKDSPDPMIDLSLMLLDFNRTGDAQLYAGKSLKIKETSTAYFVLGEAAMKNGAYWKAKEYYEKSVSLDAEMGISYNGLGRALMKLTRYSQADTAFSAALAVMPGSPEILNNIGKSLELSGKIKEAGEYYKRAAEAGPGNQVITNNINRLKDKKE